MRTFIATIAKMNISVKERAKLTVCKKKEQNLDLVNLLRNDFLQKCISRTFPKKYFFQGAPLNGPF